MPANRKILTLRDQINKSFGGNAAHLASEMPPIEFITSGSLALDFALGTGGVPRNRCIEIVGEEGSGKTTLALLMAKQVILDNPNRAVLLLDLEHKLTPTWMAKLVGEDLVDNIIVAAPDHAEEATNMYVQALRTGEVSACIYDSIGGAPTMAAQNKDAMKAEFGGNAVPISRWARLAAIHSAKYDCLTIGLNQQREDMEGYKRVMTPGGRAWRHATVARIHLKRDTQAKFVEKINGEDIQVGYKIVAKVFKNQLATPYRVAEWTFYNEPNRLGPLGIDVAEECARLSTLIGVVERNGSWISHPALPPDGKGLRRVNGYGKYLEAIQADEKVRATIVADTIAALKADESALSKVAPVRPDDNDEDLQALMAEEEQDAAEDAAAEEAEELARVDAETNA